MKTFIAAIALVAALVAPGARSADIHLELGIGQTHYQPHQDGIWYQSGMPHRLGLDGRAWMVGVTGDAFSVGPMQVAYHADYINFGHASSHCLCSPRDDYYNTVTHELRPGSPVQPANYVGHGSAQGIKLALAPYMNVGAWKIGVEVGVVPYRPSWHEVAYNWAYFPGPTRDNRLNTDGDVYLGEITGVFVSRGHWTVRYERYSLHGDSSGTDRPGHPWVPTLFTGSNNLMVTYTF